MRILLVEPDFPKPSKSKNHHDFLPIGLLKLAAYHRKKGNAICLIRGTQSPEKIFFEHSNGQISKKRIPHQILITSYFTYWSKYVKETVSYYRNIYPEAKIIVGGIYASLMPDHCKEYTGCDEIYIGVHQEAEKCKPAYHYLEKHYGFKDYQILHTSRGCIRKCGFCGVYKIEPEFTFKKSIKNEIVSRKLIFYDNNLLANPNIEEILRELVSLKEKQQILWCDAQSGIDGRILLKKPHLALLLHKAGFKYIRMSWDGPLKDAPKIKKQIDILNKAGFNLRRRVLVFMLYNWNIPFEEMEKKRLKCWEWKVQISDCRYRPLDQTFDNYSGHKFKLGQTKEDYYIHKKANWTDAKIRIFRKHIRQQNICIRLRINFYSNVIERSYLRDNIRDMIINIAKHQSIEKSIPILNKLKISYWSPKNFNGNGYQITKESIFREYEKITNKKALIHGNERTTSFLEWRNKVQKKVYKNYLN